jgi:hypothetical protein
LEKKLSQEMLYDNIYEHNSNDKIVVLFIFTDFYKKTLLAVVFVQLQAAVQHRIRVGVRGREVTFPISISGNEELQQQTI